MVYRDFVDVASIGVADIVGVGAWTSTSASGRCEGNGCTQVKVWGRRRVTHAPRRVKSLDTYPY